MTNIVMRRSALALAGAVLVWASPIGVEAREGAKNKATILKELQRKQKAREGRRSTQSEEEPFCVRPFEYPRQGR